jgi:hypothetical protein
MSHPPTHLSTHPLTHQALFASGPEQPEAPPPSEEPTVGEQEKDHPTLEGQDNGSTHPPTHPPPSHTPMSMGSSVGSGWIACIHG